MTITQNVRRNAHKQPRRAIPTSFAQSALADDRLEGAGAIALFVYGIDDLRHRKQVFHMIRQKQIPFGKIGGRLIASKQALTDWQNRITGAAR